MFVNTSKVIVGDCRDELSNLAFLGMQADCLITDP